MTDDIITVARAAEILKVTPRRVQFLINQGRLPASRFGSLWMLHESDVRAHRPKPRGRPPAVA